MVKGQQQSAYVALPMGEDEGTQTMMEEEPSSEGGACATFSKIVAFATLVSLVVVGAAHMSCGGKHHYHHQTNQLRAHEKKHSYWQRGGEQWGRHHGHHHGDALPGPHHVPHNTMFGHHEDHEQDLPEVLRHPMHKPGKNQAVVKVHASREQQSHGLTKTSVKLPPGVHVIKHPPHVDPLPKELQHPNHHGKQNTVHVNKAEPEDEESLAIEINHNKENQELPEVVVTHARSNGNGNQGTYKVHAERHSNKPAPREVSSSLDEEEDNAMTDEEWNAKLDQEIAQLEADFEHDFYGQEAEEEFELEDEDEEFDDEEEDEEWEDDEDEEFDDELEIEWDEDEDELDWDEDEDESEGFDSEDDIDESEEEWEDEVLEAVEELEANDEVVAEERIEEP